MAHDLLRTRAWSGAKRAALVNAQRSWLKLLAADCQYQTGISDDGDTRTNLFRENSLLSVTQSRFLVTLSVG